MFDEMVTIEVIDGFRKRKTFLVHKGVVSFYSGFFDKAFNGKFEEGKEGVVSLQDEHAEIVGPFVRWMYTRQLDDVPDTGDNFNNIYLKLWEFADRREIPLMMNDALKRIQDELVRTWKFPKDMFRDIYANSTPSSAIRRFLIWVITRSYTFGDMEEARAYMPEEMLGDLLVEMTKYRTSARTSNALMGAGGLRNVNICLFHRHEAGATCPPPPC